MSTDPDLLRQLNNAVAVERLFLRYPAFIWFASILHIIWGVVLISANAQIQCVPLAGLYSIIPEPIPLGMALIIAAVLAIWFPPKGTDKLTFKIITLLPQQYFTVLSGASAIQAIEVGHYADGVVRPRSFIFADQLPAILAVGFHTAALLLFMYLGSKGRV